MSISRTLVSRHVVSLPSSSSLFWRRTTTTPSLYRSLVARRSLVSSPKSSPSTTTAASTTEPSASDISSSDPHLAAAARIRNDPKDNRMPGTESLELVSASVKMRNAAMASALFLFCTWVGWYSMQAVGKADGTFEQEALEARRAQQEQQRNQEPRDWNELDMGVSEQELEEGVTLAIAAPEDVASEEEEKRNRTAGKKGDRPLWKRIVLFWK